MSFIDRFENGYYRVLNTDGKYGLFARNTDKNAAEICKQVINPEYTYLEYGNDDLLIYSKGEDALTRKYGFMNYSGENRTDEIYLSARVAGDKLVTTKENDDNEIETSVMNSNLTVAFTFVCDELSDFKNGFAIFEKNSLFGYVREDGKVIYEATLLYADEFKADGFAVARTDDGYGVLNDNGKWQIGAIYQNVSHFTF